MITRILIVAEFITVNSGNLQSSKRCSRKSVQKTKKNSVGTTITMNLKSKKMISKRGKVNKRSKNVNPVALPIGVTVVKVLIWLCIMAALLY